MQLTALQKSTAQAIVNIFETGSIRGNYADVTLLPGDSGQLTYGRSQTTLASGNLFLLIQDYSARTDGSLSAKFKPYLPQLQACDTALNNDMTFRGLLKDAGSDPVMQEVQDAFFDRIYWDPAMRSADALGAQSALGAAIVYDSTVHGSWAHVRDLTRAQFGELKQVGEIQWMSDYVETRRNWLATYPNPLLHKTVYRMDAFRLIINSGNWKLALPVVVRGLTITADSLSDTHPVNVPAEGTPRRQLRLTTPPMTGPDVSWLQDRLTLAGMRVASSGTFDGATDAAVRAFQTANDLKADGVVGPVTRTALEDVPLITPTKSLTPAAAEPMPAVAQVRPATSAAAPSTAAPSTAAPAATQPSADAASDIKQHVTTQVKAGVAAVQKTVTDSHQQIVSLVAPHAKTAAPQKAPGPVTVQQMTTALSTLKFSSRPMIAGVTSAVILLFTEIRDAIGWVAAGLTNAGFAFVKIPPFPNLPQSPQDAARFFTQVYAYLNALAASLPNEWMFRIRVVAIVLIVYAIYRLRAAHVNLTKLQQGFEQAQSDISTVKQDVATAQQIAQDVEQVVQTVK
jgi:chitosanase